MSLMLFFLAKEIKHNPTAIVMMLLSVISLTQMSTDITFQTSNASSDVDSAGITQHHKFKILVNNYIVFNYHGETA